jgi:hypothetical protein
MHPQEILNQKVFSSSAHYKGSVGAVEGYNSKKFHLRSCHHYATISSSQALQNPIS